jgi:hypothetical protein
MKIIILMALFCAITVAARHGDQSKSPRAAG